MLQKDATWKGYGTKKYNDAHPGKVMLPRYAMMHNLERSFKGLQSVTANTLCLLHYR